MHKYLQTYGLVWPDVMWVASEHLTCHTLDIKRLQFQITCNIYTQVVNISSPPAQLSTNEESKMLNSASSFGSD